jgi:archaemetzincin
MQRPALEIRILPFTGTDPAYPQALREELTALGFAVNVLKPAAVPAGAYDPRRRQYRAEVLLDRIRVAPGEHVLGVTELDLYVEELNFVFGLADPHGRAAIIALPRLRLGADAPVFRARMTKEAVHELGHTLGLAHCPDRACVMAFSNMLADTDRKGAWFCRRCLAWLGWG